MDKQRIGWIGLGNMGTPMARNHLNAGFPLTVYNRTESKAAALVAEGAQLVQYPGALWEKSDIIVTMVSDDAALKKIYADKGGLLETAVAGKIVIGGGT